MSLQKRAASRQSLPSAFHETITKGMLDTFQPEDIMDSDFSVSPRSPMPPAKKQKSGVDSCGADYYPCTSIPTEGWFQPCRYCRSWTAGSVEASDGSEVPICGRCKTKLSHYCKAYAQQQAMASQLGGMVPMRRSASSVLNDSPSSCYSFPYEPASRAASGELDAMLTSQDMSACTTSACTTPRLMLAKASLEDTFIQPNAVGEQQDCQQPHWSTYFADQLEAFWS